MASTERDAGIMTSFAAAVWTDTGHTRDARRWLERVARTTTHEAGDVLVEQHALAQDLHFLADGAVAYEHLISSAATGETITAGEHPWMPIGWTGIHLRRYRATISATGRATSVAVPLAAMDRLRLDAPRLWAHLLRFTFTTAVDMLWVARRTSGHSPNHAVPQRDALPLDDATDFAMLSDLYSRSGCFSPLPAECRDWLAAASTLRRADPGVAIMREGEASDGLWLLQGGRVSMRFETASNVGQQTAQRYAVRPGTLLCWSAPSMQLPAPYTIEATRTTRLAHVPASALTALLHDEPAWAGAIISQQLWQLRNYLVSTRTQYSDGADDGGVGAVAGLIEDSMPVLPVNSSLYGVPYLLRNRLTREEGFQRLFGAHFEGDHAEAAVASRSLELVRKLERSHRFFTAMQSTYNAVVRADDADPSALRRVSSQYFRKALTHVPYVISGWEHLPDDGNCILVYNHMAYAEDSVLPNGFLFNPDSHFLSSMVMEPKYGDGIRVARDNAVTEFWRADYYERLGHLAVATAESGWLEESPQQKRQRKEAFFAACQDVLASGRAFAIAPEGTITEEESTTEQSPGPMRPGAFLMSARFPSKPTIVPVAFANFDKPAHSAVFSCVIGPAFTMEERGIDVEDRDALEAFLHDYRGEFRRQVEAAIELAARVQSPEADLDGLITNVGNVDDVHEEFEHDVRALELRLADPVGGEGTTAFYGSSTFRMWDGLPEDLDLDDVVNLGFGGSTFAALHTYFERIVVPHRPGRLVVYCGDNDISRGAGPEAVTDDFRRLCDAIETHLPLTDCWLVSIKPSPGRGAWTDAVLRTNALLRDETVRRPRWAFVDWFQMMVADDGEADPALFEEDKIHVNDAGYARLADVLRPALH